MILYDCEQMSVPASFNSNRTLRFFSHYDVNILGISDRGRFFECFQCTDFTKILKEICQSEHIYFLFAI